MKTKLKRLAASGLLIAVLAGAPFGARAANGRAAGADSGAHPAAAPVRRGGAAPRSCEGDDAVSRRILREYGAVFLAGEGVLPPPVCLFSGPEAVTSFQAGLPTLATTIGGVVVELQEAAMRALLAAREEALAAGLDITPRDGSEAARRDYEDTVRIWNSRLLPAIEHWRREGKLTRAEAGRLRSLPAREQVGAVLEFEARGIFFSRDFSKSILYSAAAPGASQHLSLLAFDASEYADPRVRRILSRHGWFRTVRNDAPHFTYLGLPEGRLPARGLKKLTGAAGEFWVPNA
jgi:hypothetical protein